MKVFNKGLGIFLLRLFIGLRLIYGTIDNVFNWNRMLEFKSFLATHNFPLPLASAVVSVYAQLICGILFLLGWKIRWAGVIMMLNFLVAIFVEIPNGIEAMTPALAIFFSSLLFVLEGPGAISIQNQQSTLRYD
jgi:putative oxidoreductase